VLDNRRIGRVQSASREIVWIVILSNQR